MLVVAGLSIMLILSLTQLVPGIRIAGYSVFVGIAFFFCVEAVSGTTGDQSGLRFRSFLSDIKKDRVLPFFFLPVATQLIAPPLGDYIFYGEYTAHVISRAGSMLSYEDILLLFLQIIIAAFGEEIAWRGFFLGKSMGRFPFWPCAVVSSALFAIGHTAPGNIVLVLFDIGFVFADSIIYSIVFKKAGNCLISTVSHIMGNTVGIIICLAMA